MSRRPIEFAQYLPGEYRDLIAEPRMVQSVGRTGIGWDNSVAEATWSSLKRELVHRYRFPDRVPARRAIFAWINCYNACRRHSSLGYIPPIEWENQYVNKPTRPRNQRDRVSGGTPITKLPNGDASEPQ